MPSRLSAPLSRCLLSCVLCIVEIGDSVAIALGLQQRCSRSELFFHVSCDTCSGMKIDDMY